MQLNIAFWNIISHSLLCKHFVTTTGKKRSIERKDHVNSLKLC